MFDELSVIGPFFIMFWIFFHSGYCIFYNFSQVLDHYDFHSDISFDQRYYINENTRRNNTKSIIVYIGGRHPLADSLFVDGSVLHEISLRTNSVLVGLEHRFFGYSIPTNLTQDYLKYLTVEQALGDIESFIRTLQNSRICINCSVGIIGSVYAGALASWFRIRYPHMSVGAWASSAPVELIDEFPDHDIYLAQYLNRTKNCYDDTKSIFDALHGIMTGTDHKLKNQTKIDFGLNESQDDISFLYTIAEVMSAPLIQQENLHLLDEHCKKIHEDKSINGFRDSYINISKEMKIVPAELDPFLFDKTTKEYFTMYLSCNQIGWFRTSAGLIRSPYVNMTYYNRVCRHLFDMNATYAYYTNSRFGGTDPSISSVVYTSGLLDPFRRLTVLQNQSFMGRHSYLIPNEGQSSDLNVQFGSENKALEHVRDLCIEKMSSWVNHECENKCVMGQCVLTKCVCIDMWDGENCDHRTHTTSFFKTVSIIAVILPAIMLVMITMAMWVCANRTEKDIGKKRTMFTTGSID